MLGIVAFTAAGLLSAHGGAGYSASVIVDGSPAPEYAGRGRVYIEALRGKEFTIRLSNPTAGRVAVALSVDGRNVIDAKRSSELEATKWILEPYQTVEIPGWQVSGETARKFFFTETSRSYAKWLGDTANVGTIEAVFFREKPREPKLRAKDEAPAAPPPAELEGGAARSAPAPKAPAKTAQADNFAATGIGDRTANSVQWVAFDEDPTPVARVSIRYEFRNELVRLGVLPRADAGLAAREKARGFEHDYAPDPDSRH
jgi:hypothetical protein